MEGNTTYSGQFKPPDQKWAMLKAWQYLFKTYCGAMSQNHHGTGVKIGLEPKGVRFLISPNMQCVCIGAKKVFLIKSARKTGYSHVENWN